MGIRQLGCFAKLRSLGGITLGFVLIIPFLSQPLSSQATSGEESKERNFCTALEASLSSPDRHIPLERDLVKGCSYSELVIIFSESWPQLVSNHIEYVDHDGVPVNFYRALQAKQQGDTVQAIHFADVVFQKVIRIFWGVGDVKRGGIYTSLVVSWRNEIIASLAAGSAGWVTSLEQSEREYLKIMGLDKYFSLVSPGDIFVCLLTSDPGFGDVEHILESKKFRKCLDEEVEM